MEVSTVTGKLILPPANHTGLNMNNSKGLQQKRTLEMEATINYGNEPPQQDSSPPEKKGAVDPATLFEMAVAGGNEKINMLFAKYGDILSDRVATDVSQMRKLEGILLEAKSLESHLKEKKKHLGRTLAHISDKLTG